MTDTGKLRIHFETAFNDVRQRPSVHHLVYNLPEKALSAPNEVSTEFPKLHHDTIVLLADKTCSITGLAHTKLQTHKTTTETLFEACLPRSVIRLHRGSIRPPWRRSSNNGSTTPSTGLSGILADDILGACTDGTIYSFSILSQPALRLLRLVQNLLEAKQKRDSELQYNTIKNHSSDILRLLQNGADGSQDEMIRARDVDPELMDRGQGAPRFRHVDGDLIVRFLEGDGNFERLVGDGCDLGVRALFDRTLNALVDEGKREGKLELKGRNSFEAVGMWVSDVLMPLL
jgi:hypothetical protein